MLNNGLAKDIDIFVFVDIVNVYILNIYTTSELFSLIYLWSKCYCKVDDKLLKNFRNIFYIGYYFVKIILQLIDFFALQSV